MSLDYLKKTAISGIAAIMLGSSSGCGTVSYYSSLVKNHLEILSKARNIEEVLADPEIAEESKEKLRLVQDVRLYAQRRLHLPESSAYSTYVDLGDRDYIALNLTACEPLRFKAKEWCHPFLGCQEVKGFYDQKDAENYVEELALEEQHWDVALVSISAYSTGKWLNNSFLGDYFSDPVTSVMVAKSEIGLIKLVLHETAHQVVSIEDTAFNESFANFVAREGAETYLRERRPDLKGYEDTTEGRRDRELFQEVITSFRSWLNLIYDSALPDSQKLEMKGKIFQQMRETYLEEAEQEGLGGYAEFFRKDLNNAHLLHRGNYNDYVDAFAWLFEEEAHRNWDQFYGIVKKLAEWPKAKRKEYLESLKAKS